MTGFIDPSIKRKSDIVNNALILSDDGTPLPSVVEVSESGTCNRSCAFCPRSNPNYPDVKEFVEPELINKLSEQLSNIGFNGIFLFSGFVEPMIDKNIYSLISMVRHNLPDVKIEMVSNGDALNSKRLNRLFDNGLSTILISVYDGPDEADSFEKLCKDVGLRPDQYVVRHRYLPPEKDFGITLSNRSGMMGTAEHAIPSPDDPLCVSCYYPHYTFFMDYLGDVLLCPHDWGKKYVVGNMKLQNFTDIWTGKHLEMARKRLAASDRNFSPCNKCDVKGTLMGKQHVTAWENFNNSK